MNRLPVIISIVCLLASLVLVAIAVGITRDRAAGTQTQAGVSGPVRTTGTADVGGPFRMIDQTGKPVDESILKGKWSFVFFGFTFCPDVCPTTLAKAAAVKTLLGERGDDLQVVFFTIDPERDTPQALKAYLDSVGLPSAIGLTGTPDQVAAAARAYRIFYQKRQTGDGEYTMDHSTSAYLMDPDGQFSTPLAYTMTAEQEAEIIRDAMQQRR